MVTKAKIMELRPNLTHEDFSNGNIRLRDNSDGQGIFIESWNHPTESRPTDEELA